MEIDTEMEHLLARLYPICRSITGNGVRETLKIVQEIIPLKIYEIPTGTKVFDWTIPKEWNIKDAYIMDSNKNKIVDFKKSNLHVLNYSIPIKKKVSLKELQEHLFTLPDHPEWIPYITSYYKEEWGFCMPYSQYAKLKDEIYEVVVDSSLDNGSLTYGECFIKGELEDEIILSCYVCHPSMCNDNLSGIIILTNLAKQLQKMKLKYSYRFLFIPETIGAITWLCQNEKNVSKIKCGLVVTCVGDPGNFTYKKSRKANSEIDRIVEKTLIDLKISYSIIDFFPSGSDERQFCSPGFDLDIGSFMRSMYGTFPEYHTSADNLSLVKGKYLRESLEHILYAIKILENNKFCLNLNPKCEPMLGKRKLRDTIGWNQGIVVEPIDKMALLWVLNYSDGKNSLLDISIRSCIDFETIVYTSKALTDVGLLRDITEEVAKNECREL